MKNYKVSYRESWDAGQAWPNDSWDVLLSAYNTSDRVKTVFTGCAARRKCWFISPEYQFDVSELPSGPDVFNASGLDEASAIVEFLGQTAVQPDSERICIDSTGFMRHHLLILLKCLKTQGAKSVDVLYAEPTKYLKREKTQFSDGEVQEVRQVAGFEGSHDPDTSNDLLIIGAGYDDPLIAHAAESKSNARKIQMLGLPSLKADMYQENVLRAYKAAEQIGPGFDEEQTVFMPANDPFITAETIREVVHRADQQRKITNLYLCPLSTKATTVGFGLYYLQEWEGLSASLIFPYCRTYARETSVGTSRIWRYRLEFAI